MVKRYTDEERLKIVEEISKSSLTIKEACNIAGISDVTFYQWKKNLKNKAVAMEQIYLEEDSSKEYIENKIENKVPPKHDKPKSDIDEEVENLVVNLKTQYPYYGIVRISQELLRHECIKISPTKVLKVLEKHNLNVSDFYKARQVKESVRFERAKSNQLWSTDIMPYKLKNGDRFYFIGIIDDFSRYMLAHGVFDDAKVDNVIKVLQDATAAYGLPQELLTDRGGQFHSWKGMSQFEELLARYGIKHIMAKPHNPSCNGKIEAFHRNLQKELLWRKFMDNTQMAREEILKYTDYYNHDRPHQGIGGLVPADRYFRIDDEIKKHILNPYVKGSKVYFTGKINKKVYRIEQRQNNLFLYCEDKVIETWLDIGVNEISEALNKLSSILKNTAM